ncbi:hypothetical protein [Psychrobacillus soli]|uniref:FAD synthase n=1 Tax=Psychrobacillus soli TaxID=1543965 RepID=A0A544STL7_9BACI|nr:hypothetical protein [Psychrobacillus soli]TQR08564.1 hypothetical protein FG383_16600 [Psychrobacillus soli]
MIKTAGDVAKEKSTSLSVMSFFPHPKTILSKGNTELYYLMPISKKASILESLGVDSLYVVKFDKDFLSLFPEQFISSYCMNVIHAVAGFDFTYGHRSVIDIPKVRMSLYRKMN